MLQDALNKMFLNEEDNGGGGGGGNPEDTLTLKKAEFEQRLTNKFGEGAAKERARILEDFGVKTVDELKKKVNDPEVVKKLQRLEEVETEFQKASTELSQIKSERLAIKLGASAEMAENVVALLKGKNQDLTEENIKKALEVFQKGKAVSFGTTKKGDGDEGNKPKPKVNLF